MDKIKNFLINFKNADKAVQLRIIAVAIGVINLVLYMCGKEKLPITAEMVWTLITTIYTAIISFIAMWKNNSITPEAKEGDKLMKQLKAEKKAQESK